MLEKGISFVSDMSNMPGGIHFAIYFVANQDPYSVNIGSCSYLVEDHKEYKLFRMLENGILPDVHTSNMP